MLSTGRPRFTAALLVLCAPAQLAGQGTSPPEEGRPESGWVDWNGDGRDDLALVLPEGDLRLLQNAGDGRFEDATELAGLRDVQGVREAVWTDVDGDGDPDLLAIGFSGRLKLFANARGAFQGVGAGSGLELLAGVESVAWHDFDGDALPDLLVRTEGGFTLHRNLGEARFELMLAEEAPADAVGVVTLPELEAPEATGSPTGVVADDVGDGSRGEEARDNARSGNSAPATTRVATERAPSASTPPMTSHGMHVTPIDMWVDETGDTMTGTLTLSPAGDQALDLAAGSVYKAGASFLHTKGGAANLGLGTEALANVTTGGEVTALGDGALRDNTSGYQNTAAGALTLHQNTTGSGNTALGSRALYHNTTGGWNTASGVGALYANTTGEANTAHGFGALAFSPTGSRNTATGYGAMAFNDTGTDNTATGHLALKENSSGSFNTATGVNALYLNTIGSYNTATGNSALLDNSTGTRNTATGHQALLFNTSGSYNTATGSNAMLFNTTGSSNTATGQGALSANTFGQANVALGVRALASNTSGQYNTAVGSWALEDSVSSYANSAVGKSALSSNTTGSFNTSVGASAMLMNTTGDYNTASGERALASNTTGLSNAGFGAGALKENTTGSNNTAVGTRALGNNVVSDSNTALGFNAMRMSTAGSLNTAVGRGTLYSSEGTYNVGVGYYAGSAFTSGSDNIAISHPGLSSDSATTRIGEFQTRAFLAGVRGVTTDVADAIPVLVDSQGQLGTISSSQRFKQEIEDMGDSTDRLLDLRPVVFRYRGHVEAMGDGAPLEFGLIAEEVAEVFPELVVRDEEGRPFTVKYHLLSSMLLNELQRASEDLRGLRAEYGKRIEELEEALSTATGRR